MKVVAIQGSPHKGNTYERVENFAQALSEHGEIEFDHIALKDSDLKPCQGCFLCFTRGERACPLNDDIKSIRIKLDESDAVIFATPVYSMQISYLLKIFVDRMAYTFHRPRYFGKYAVGLAVTGAVGLKETLDYISMFSEAWGFEYLGGLRYVDPPGGTGIPRFAGKKDRCRELAGELYMRMKTKPQRKLKLKDHMAFHIMRTVYGRMEKYSPTDYAYWKSRGWLEPGARYFFENAGTGFFRGLYARIVARLMARKM
ncbi:MAG: hypothetical protein GF417_03410, partial [Candidatus Latescibacteria bacterium]|nr:hypothetical protein [bacterium]MBD3423476.1 hypothetical protein [Candidatus Latescibacterota bacterium]